MPHRKAINNTQGHVVVVDDDPSVRQSVHTLLKREGYRVSVYDSADALLQNPVFDPPSVLLTDVRMSGASGVDLQTQP
jgi:FixJ family two-component response regulator